MGSNVGEREQHLRAAIEVLGAHGVEVEAVSSAYETEPVGEILDQPDFLNAAMRIRTSLESESLLDVCKGIEAEHGRAFAGPRHSPRPLDIDLLLLGEIELETERLTLPHPEVPSRASCWRRCWSWIPRWPCRTGRACDRFLADLPAGERVARFRRAAAGR